MNKKMLIRIFSCAALLAAAIAIPSNIWWIKLISFLPAYLIIGWDVLWRAIRNILKGQVFDENFLMALATVGALIIGEYPEAVAVMLFYQVGEMFQDYAVERSRKSITNLMDIRPDYANLEAGGITKKVAPDTVDVGSIISVRPGEKIPLDGTIIEGFSSLDTSALTGEALPRDVSAGDTALSGCVNLSGVLRIEVTKTFGESTVAKILNMVENASNKKAKPEKFITKFARYYTPIVVISAAFLAILPPLFFGGDWKEWTERALIFLVISCPCALVISVPMSFFGGIGGASKQGVLIKGSNYIESLSHVKTVVFDKTGTLTKGNFKVNKISAAGEYNEEQILEIAALAESFSDHPISQSLKTAYGKDIDSSRVTDVKELSGRGICVKVDDKNVIAGNDKLMKDFGVNFTACLEIGTIVYIAVEKQFIGYVLISDELKVGAKEAVSSLKAQGVDNTVMLTGDSKTVADSVASALNIDKVYSQLLPGDKVDKVEELLGTLPKGSKLMFVGDGINDAPVISRADVGTAMGGLGSDAAIEAADVVLMDDNPQKLGTAIKISKKTMGIVYQNIIFALGIKFIILILGALGFANMWLAVFADVGVAFIAIINAMRALYIKD